MPPLPGTDTCFIASSDSKPPTAAHVKTELWRDPRTVNTGERGAGRLCMAKERELGDFEAIYYGVESPVGMFPDQH